MAYKKDIYEDSLKITFCMDFGQNKILCKFMIDTQNCKNSHFWPKI